MPGEFAFLPRFSTAIILRWLVSRSGPIGFQFSCWCVSAGGRNIDRGQVRHPAEIPRRFLRRDRFDRQFQLSTDHLGNIAQGNTFLAHRVVARPA
jgi:hypothetical protein